MEYFTTRIKKTDYLFLFVAIIYAGNASAFVRSFSYWDNIFGLMIPIVLAISFAVYYKIPIRKNFLYLILAFTIIVIATFIKFKVINERFYFIWTLNFFIAYILVSRLKENFFIAYENILYFLCLVALVFWGLRIIAPYTIADILSRISLEPGSRNVEANIIFYTINIDYIKTIIPRNAGFAWEPGAFAAYTSLAIFINLIRTEFRLKNNRKLYVLLITLTTTLSTTGFLILIVLGIFYLYNVPTKIGLLIFPVAVILIIVILRFPFMVEKIIEVAHHDTDLMIRNSVRYGSQQTAQRIASFLIDFKDFLNHPIIGYGGHQDARWTVQIGANISTISGIGKIMARFGLIGTIFFFFSIYKSAESIQQIFSFKGRVFMILIIFIISISYSIIENPLVMSFWLFYLFHKPISVNYSTNPALNKTEMDISY